MLLRASRAFARAARPAVATRSLVGSVVFAEHEPVTPPPGAVTVTEVRAYVVCSKSDEEAAGGGADCHSQSHGHWIVDTPIANPMSIYSGYKHSRKSWGIDAPARSSSRSSARRHGRPASRSAASPRATSSSATSTASSRATTRATSS